MADDLDSEEEPGDVPCEGSPGTGGQGCGDDAVEEASHEESMECHICEQPLPLSDFPVDKDGKVKGVICLEDCATIESWQRQLRKEWGDNYKTKYGALRKNKPEWRREIRVYKMNNPRGTKGRHKIKMETHTPGLRDHAAPSWASIL